MIKKILFLIFGIMLISMGGIAWRTNLSHRVKPIQSNGKIKAIASFYPLYFFTHQIGGEKAEVKNITPAGAEPHDYEPTTQDIAQIEKSDLLILNGQLEGWGDKIKENLIGKKTVIVTAAEGLMTQNDPHVWLDPILAKKEVATILQAFIRIDPTNKTYYEGNAGLLQQKLDGLDSEFRQGLQNCRQKNIVTSHAAFGYVASRYHFTQIPIARLSPDSEPSPKQVSNIAQFAKINNVKYIFFETLVSPRLAQTIAQEVGAKTLVFNPLEGLTKKEQERGKDYFSVQKENRDNLKIALECL